MTTEISKILIVGPAWVGDMVMAQTLFKVLRTQYPTVRMDVLAPPWSLPIIERMPEIYRGIPLAIGHGEFALKKRWLMAQSLKKEAYDHTTR